MEIKLRHRTFTVEPGQNRAAWEHIASGTWEPHTFGVLDHFVQPNDVVLDLGSWSGVISLYIADKASKVYAVDPDPVCFRELVTNVVCNPQVQERIVPLQAAVSDERATIELSARKAYGQSSSSILQRARDTEQSHKLTTVPLAELLTDAKVQQLHFVKMDIEGAEFKVLPTLGGLMERLHYPTLLVSFHYAFLIEHIYAEKIASRFWNKVALKMQQWFGLTLYKQQLEQTIRAAFQGVAAYKYVYTTKGEPLTLDYLSEVKNCLRHSDLVFSNRPWQS